MALTGTYEYESEFARTHFSWGKAEGRAEGRAEGEGRKRSERAAAGAGSPGDRPAGPGSGAEHRLP